MISMARQKEGIGVRSGFLLPHPPVLIPEIGRGRERDAGKTGAACIHVAEMVAELSPEAIIILSPHTPLFSDFLYMYDSPILTGSFARFGSPELTLSAVQDTVLRDALFSQLQGASIFAGTLPEAQLARMGLDQNLDHGVLVPLYFLQKKLPKVPLVALSSPNMDAKTLVLIGECIAEAARESNRSVCVIASGDMSHRVNKESPYGVVPEGALFDQKVCNSLENSDITALRSIDTALRVRAGECGYASLVILSAIFKNPVCTLYSYEAPFGIGYCVAGLDSYPEGGSHESK